MIEKVARAICEAEGVDPEMICVSIGRRRPAGERYPAWEWRIPSAKAAIAAMREPTEEMYSAGYHVWMEDEEGRDCGHTFIAMIDAALEDDNV